MRMVANVLLFGCLGGVIFFASTSAPGLTITKEAVNNRSKLNKMRRFIYNNDGTYILQNGLHGRRPLTIEDVKKYVDIVSETPITTYAICSNSLMPYYESRYERSIGCLADGQRDTRETIPGVGNVNLCGENLRRLREAGTDIVEICVNRAKEIGLEAFVTMRMNDLHFTDTLVRNPLEQSDFWLEHPEFRVGAYPGWHADGAFNFACVEVREYKLNFIREMCGRFNMDGLELDFMRFPVYFPYGKGKEYLGLMTDFVAEVRKIVDEAGQKRGRPILLAVRIPPDLHFCHEIGLDIRAWVDRKIIDLITLSAFYIDDPLLPVLKFKRALGQIDVPLYASLDSGLHLPRESRSHGMYRASAARLYGEGVDGLYLFNFFFLMFSLLRPGKPNRSLER